MPLTTSVLHDDGVALLALGGELDLEGLDQVSAVVRQTLALGFVHLVVDLTALSFCDSSGLGALLRTSRAARSAGGSCTVAGAVGSVQRLFDVTAMSHVLALTTGVSVALEQAYRFVREAAPPERTA